jgi:aryl carrier-like protein
MTWLRSESDVTWLSETGDAIDAAVRLVEQGLDSLSG